MGIWNVRSWTPVASPRVLITPHGDLEPSSISGSARARSASHYPSWGFGTAAYCAGVAGALALSLPLMGIWNWCALSAPAAASTTHYPSWGFGTRRRPPPETGGLPSLPLMGIWNLDESARLDLALRNSLPLMGIWNPRKEAVAAWRDWMLITPHGDLEPPECTLRVIGRLGSLPLMGIWNVVRR